MTRLLILQGDFSEYRRPVFNELANYYPLTVAHSGRAARRDSDGFAEHILPVRPVGPFRLVDRTQMAQLRAGHDAVIAMFDLAWPQFWLPALSRQSAARQILWGHRYGARALANRARDAIMQRADALLMYGWEHIDQMVAAGIDRQRIFVAPNTMAVGNHQDFSASPKDSFLFVGRLQERKRLDIALRAMQVLADRCDRVWRFDIVGDGAIRRALEDEAKSLGIIQRVHFHGAITGDEALMPLFARALAYVSPGPVGLSVLHSFAYGVPVVTMREGYHGPEFHNLKDGENGRVVDDPDQLAIALLRLLEEPEESRRMGHNAYTFYARSRLVGTMVDGMRSAVEGRDIGSHRRD